MHGKRIGYAGTFKLGNQENVRAKIENNGGIPITKRGEEMDYLVIGSKHINKNNQVLRNQIKKQTMIVTEEWLDLSTKGPSFVLQDPNKYKYIIDNSDDDQKDNSQQKKV